MGARKKALNKPEAVLAGLALVILLATILFSYRDWLVFRQASLETGHAREVMDATENLISAMTDAETGQRGFLLTGDRHYLEPYQNALAVIPGHLKDLIALTQSRRQADRARELDGLITRELALLKQTIDAKANQAPGAAIDIAQLDRGKQEMDRIRRVCSEMTHEEYSGLLEQSRTAEVHGQRTRLFTALGSATLFIFLLIAGALISSAAARREQLIAELRASEARIAEVRDLMQTTLSSIGDAVIATDAQGRVTFINPVAQALTDCSHEHAAGKPVEEVFHIVNETTRKVVESPVAKVLREGTIVGLANHTALLSRTGRETPIDDSGAPIRDPRGGVAGVVLVFRDITARKKAEQESLRLAAIVESSDDAIIAQQLDGVITSANAGAERMFGYPAAEIVGRNFSILTIPGAQDPPEVMERIRRGELAVHYDAVRRRKDGSVVEVAIVVSPIRDPEGNVVGASRICRDITDRRRAEQALRSSNKQIADILESIRDGFVAIDKDWVFTYVNAAAEKMLGKSRSELIGRTYWQEYPSALGTPTEERLHRAAADQAAISFEEYYKEMGDWLEVSLFPAAGNGLSIYFRNITERKQTLEALRQSEERLRLSAEAAQIGAWNSDLIAGGVTWSPELEKLFGLDPGSFRGTNEHFRELVHPDDRDRVLEVMKRALERTAGFDVEFRFLRPDGELGWMLARGGPRVDEAGAVVSMAGVAIDITSRKRLEEKMRQTQKLESLGILAGGIAHDFNNLLVGILGNASLLLEDTPEDSPSRGVIENLLHASDRAAHLTRQMLAYSGRGRFVIERLNLENQVQQILALIGASIPKAVELEFDFQPDLPPVEGDSGQLQQLIMNLVINAAEAIESESGTVAISTRLREIESNYVKDNLAGDTIPPGSYIVLEVHDTGIGMDAATQARIFDPFFTTKFTGRGLGLAAVLGIVRGHKGALTVYSEPGNGTTFKVFLPVAETGKLASTESSPHHEFRGEATILIVDDEEVIQRTLKAALERYGYTVLTASGGTGALEILREMRDPIALVLLDMTMPVLSGEQTLRRLQSMHPDLPVIATSGYNEVEALRRFGDGLSGFIQKPFTPRKLAEKIRAVLERNKPAAASD